MIFGRVTATMGVPNTSNPNQFERFGEVVPIFEQANRLITGVTKNSSGSPLGSCTVDLYNSATELREQTTVSDASGNYSFTVDPTMRYYCVAYLVGAPDVFGTTANTLAGA
jgi:hypothetical protein